ncbi:Os07g0438700, partial [Oryza sativa Japonica Group]
SAYVSAEYTFINRSFCLFSITDVLFSAAVGFYSFMGSFNIVGLGYIINEAIPNPNCPLV